MYKVTFGKDVKCSDHYGEVTIQRHAELPIPPFVGMTIECAPDDYWNGSDEIVAISVWVNDGWTICYLGDGGDESVPFSEQFDEHWSRYGFQIDC